MFGKDNPFKTNTNNTSSGPNIFGNIGPSQSLLPANSPSIQTNNIFPSINSPNLGVSQNKQEKNKPNIFVIHQQKNRVEQSNLNKKKQVQSSKQPDKAPLNLFQSSTTQKQAQSSKQPEKAPFNFLQSSTTQKQAQSLQQLGNAPFNFLQSSTTQKQAQSSQQLGNAPFNFLQSSTTQKQAQSSQQPDKAPLNLFQPSKIVDNMNSSTDKKEFLGNKIFGDTPSFLNFSGKNNVLNMQTIQKQSQSVEKKLFGGVPNKNAQSSVLNVTTQKVVVQEATKFPSKTPTQNSFLNKETIKNIGKQIQPSPQKDEKLIAQSRRKEQQKLYGLTLKQIQKLTAEIERDIWNRRGQIEYIQSVKESMVQQRNEKKEKIITELRKQKNNVILNNNNTLEIEIFTQRVQQEQDENKKMAEQRQEILIQIKMLDNQIEKQKEKQKELNHKITRPDFPLIEPSVSVQQALSKICKFLPSNKIREQEIKLKEKIQTKAKIEEKIKQYLQITKKLENELARKQEQYRATQNQIINILEDEQELKDYLNNNLKPTRIELEKQYQKLKKQVKQIKKNKRNSRQLKAFQGFSQIY